jgi:hypothetical protein
MKFFYKFFRFHKFYKYFKSHNFINIINFYNNYQILIWNSQGKLFYSKFKNNILFKQSRLAINDLGGGGANGIPRIACSNQKASGVKVPFYSILTNNYFSKGVSVE